MNLIRALETALVAGLVVASIIHSIDGALAAFVLIIVVNLMKVIR